QEDQPPQRQAQGSAAAPRERDARPQARQASQAQRRLSLPAMIMAAGSLAASRAGEPGSVMEHKPIFVVSDSTGETAERVVRAALLQFPDQRVRVRLFTRVRDPDAITDVLTKAKEQQALVVFTLVRPELRETFHEIARLNEVESVDVIGSLIHKVGNFLESDPVNIPSADMPLSEEYFRR